MLLTQTSKQAALTQEIDALVNIMVETVPVEMVYLFGSYAYGTPRDDSDLDLYVVFRDDMEMRELDALVTARVAMAPVQIRRLIFFSYLLVSIINNLLNPYL